MSNSDSDTLLHSAKPRQGAFKPLVVGINVLYVINFFRHIALLWIHLIALFFMHALVSDKAYYIASPIQGRLYRSMKTRYRYLSTSGIALCCLMMLAAGCSNRPQAQSYRQQVQQQAAPNQTVRPLSETEERVEVAEQAANKIVSEVPSVKSANVLVTRRNAYVAAVLKDGQAQMTQDVESQIAQKVRATDANIQNVYVSVNPDFVSRVNRYVDDVRAGRPISGFVQEFAEMVRRVFPNAR